MMRQPSQCVVTVLQLQQALARTANPPSRWSNRLVSGPAARSLDGAAQRRLMRRITSTTNRVPMPARDTATARLLDELHHAPALASSAILRGLARLGPGHPRSTPTDREAWLMSCFDAVRIPVRHVNPSNSRHCLAELP